ncbi:MAG: hypothetical protein AAF497_29030 [Planctomycetota bacterium]
MLQEPYQLQRIRSTLTVLIAVFLMLNVIGTAGVFNMPFSSNRWEMIICAGGAGFMLGQVALLALWGVLGGESAVRRFPRSAGLSIAIFFSWVAGTHLGDDPLPPDIAVILSLFGLLVFSIVTAPLWFVGVTWPMRIWHPTQVADDQFSIRTIMVWTATVAVCMAVGLRLFQNNISPGGMPPVSILYRMIPMLAGIGIFIVALALPLLWAILTPRPQASIWAVIGVVFLLGPPILLMTVVALSGSRMSTDDFMAALLAWYVFYVVMSIVVVGCLLLLRAFGFRYRTPEPPKLLSPFADGS